MFLPHCLDSIQRVFAGTRHDIMVLDNVSTDASCEIAKQRGARVMVKRSTQAEALNALVDESTGHLTLLLHADVILISDALPDLCASRLTGECALVSPEDIGCGPWSRPFGAGKPESSFMLFRTDALRRLRQWRRAPSSRLPRKLVDFYGPHITHRLPDVLSREGLSWAPMSVHLSRAASAPYFQPSFAPRVWSDELAFLRYGLGNFYSIDGVVTHYHNWYERVDCDVPLDSTATTEANGGGFPKAFIRSYSERFLQDCEHGTIDLPTDLHTQRVPVAL